ncbi:uncharacterized protein LOC141905339 [Tubulanus polymorphus]|uniref:uncharacterized protein LOC141905339 n=1 Tax=Tubulanus polymorphus TaxID=672921 RepID=UPI003DA44AA0
MATNAAKGFFLMVICCMCGLLVYQFGHSVMTKSDSRIRQLLDENKHLRSIIEKHKIVIPAIAKSTPKPTPKPKPTTQSLQLSTEFQVPNHMHYTWYHPTKLTWRFHHMISVLSAQRFNKPEKIFFWYEKYPQGPLWNETLKKVPNIVMKYRKKVTSVFGRPVNVPEHQSDIVRLDAVMNYGGIYTDLDVVIVKSFDPLRKYATTMGLETPGGLCNGIIISKANASFLKIWHQSYKTFNDNQWAYHSVQLPAQLAAKHPNLIHVEPRSLHRPNWMEREWIYNTGKLYDLSKNYAVHTWFRFYNKDHTAEDIKKLNTTLGRLYRNAYYGSMDIINT